MLADLYIPRLSKDIKNNFGGQIWYRSLDPVKKTGSNTYLNFIMFNLNRANLAIF